MADVRDTTAQRDAGGRLLLHRPASEVPAEIVGDSGVRSPAEGRTGAHRVALMRIGFGLIWAIDAWYKWQPAFLNSFADQFSRVPTGAPAWVTSWLQFWKNALTPHALFFAVCTALLETVLAVGLILGLGRRSLYVVGAVFAFLIWAVPESFGRFWQSGQTDLGTSIMYVFIFVALFIVDARVNRAGWSLDRRLTVRLPWWRRVADC